MRNAYVIQWKSKVNGRAGKGTKVFELEEAEALAAELNEEYPDIDHRAVESIETALAPEPGSGSEAESTSKSNDEPAAAAPTNVLSVAD